MIRHLALCVAGTLLIESAALAATQQHLQMVVAGIEREYILVAPDALSVGPRPLVLILHGHIGTAANALGAGMAPSQLSAP